MPPRVRHGPAHVAALVALALLLTPPLVHAAEGFRVHTLIEDAPDTATAWNTQRKLVRAPDESGRDRLVAVVLEAAGDKGGARVALHASADGGASWQREATAPTGNATLRPTLARAPDGVWVAWTEWLPDENHHQVFVARYAKGSWHDHARLSHSRGYSGYPSLTVEPDGRVHAAWYGLDQGYYQVFHRVREADGAWSTPHRLSVGIPDAVNPAIVVGPDGALNVVWYKQEARHYQVWFTRRAPSGAWSDPVTVSDGPAHSMNPSLVVDARNVVHVTWDRQDPDGRHLWGASAPAGRFGSHLAHPLTITGVDRADASFPSLALLPDGRAVVAWSAPDGIRVARGHLNGTLQHWTTLGDAGARDANVRWQAFQQPDAPLELVFTDAGTDGARAVRYARLADAGASTPAPGALVAVGLALAAAVSARRQR